MIKRISIIIIALAALLAADAFPAPLTAQRKQEITAGINRKAASLKSMSCRFVQTKHMSLLNDRMVAEGKMSFLNPDRLRWEYTTPYSYLFIFNGTKVYVGGARRKDVIDTNTNKIFKEVARIMMNTVTGKALSASADFTVAIEDGGKKWLVTLTPRKKELRQMFTKVRLGFTKTDLMISEIDIYEKNGDRTNIVLNGVVYNGKVNESLFVVP